METKLQQEINAVLKAFPEYWHENTLLKNKLIEDIRSYNKKIIEALMSNELVRDTYALQLQSGAIFKIEDFVSMLRFKNYWDNSYTKYTNEIGLTSENKYLKYNTDVVLDFPHKDSVLEGGMSKEDIEKREIYYHNVIAKEEIDSLLSSKVLSNLKKYDKNGEHKLDSFEDKDNLIIKGNNLIGLQSLKKRYASKINLVYIDPPYNTGNDSFKYNDRFNHSTWLTFMVNRLRTAKELLSDEGSIIIQIDHNEQAYLKVLLDEIFGRENFINQIVWQRSSSGKTISKNLPSDVDYLLWYSKSKNFTFNPVFKPLSQQTQKMYSKNDNDGRGYYRLYPLQKTSSPGPETTYDYIDNEGKVWPCPKKGWRMNKHKLKALENDNRLYKAEGSISEKAYWNERENQGKLANNLWDDIYNLQGSNSEMVEFNSQKPEKIISRIIEMTTNKGDIVLDFNLGSGTTAAVAHKMGRQYIGIEQMDYIEKVSVPRLQKVIEGEQGGISKDVDWQGGGSFVYAELYSLNEEYLQAIQGCSSNEELEHIINQIKQSAYLNFKVDLEKVTTNNEDFKSLSLKEQKDVLIQVLDMNQLYLNYSEIEDSQYDISDSVKAFNHAFYQKGGDTDE